MIEINESPKALDDSGRISEERYKAFIEGINDGVYEVDVHGNFIYFNSALCRVFGYPHEDIQGQYFGQFMDEQHARQAVEMFKRIYNTGNPISDISWEIVDKEGLTRFIELSASVITDKEGRKVGFRGIARDVTEKVRAKVALQDSEYQLQCLYEESRKSAQRYRTLLDFIPYPMVVFSLEGKVTYLNPAFTHVFGWTLSELQGKRIPYVPSDLLEETHENLRKLFKEKIILRHETKRLTRDGRLLDIIMRGAVFEGDGDEPGGELFFLRDVTQEQKLARNNEAMLQISMALPAYPKLEELLDYVSAEIRRLLDVQGAVVILLDEEKNELYFLGVAHEDSSSLVRAKKIRYPADKGISGHVIRTGEPIIVSDTSMSPHFYPVIDSQLGYPTRNMLDVPLRSGDRIIGVLCALNKNAGDFDQKDVELLSMVSSTVALSIENARVSEALKEAYQEVTGMNRAKDRVINHLSHELKTPISVLSASLNILSKRFSGMLEERWKPTMTRAQRNLQRLLEIQYQVEDIMKGADFKARPLLTSMLDRCADELESLVAEEIGEGAIVERLRKRIEEVYNPKKTDPQKFRLDRFVGYRLEQLEPRFSHRRVNLESQLEKAPLVCLPGEVLRKVVDGLLKNAVENTPDGGKISLIVKGRGHGCELVIRDYGVGITESNQRRIFEGFFTTRETMDYSSKKPFDFNAGGKGADLLRMKIFAEQYHFQIEMSSTRCPHIPLESDVCPGDVAACPSCVDAMECLDSGGTTFSIYFPPVSEVGCRTEPAR